MIFIIYITAMTVARPLTWRQVGIQNLRYVDPLLRLVELQQHANDPGHRAHRTIQHVAVGCLQAEKRFVLCWTPHLERSQSESGGSQDSFLLILQTYVACKHSLTA